jgi:hypothetical protein
VLGAPGGGFGAAFRRKNANNYYKMDWQSASSCISLWKYTGSGPGTVVAQLNGMPLIANAGNGVQMLRLPRE